MLELANNSNFKGSGGEGGIRTLEAFRLTHFPGVLLQPLGHLTVFINTCTAEFDIPLKIARNVILAVSELQASYCRTSLALTDAELTGTVLL